MRLRSDGLSALRGRGAAGGADVSVRLYDLPSAELHLYGAEFALPKSVAAPAGPAARGRGRGVARSTPATSTHLGMRAPSLPFLPCETDRPNPNSSDLAI